MWNNSFWLLIRTGKTVAGDWIDVERQLLIIEQMWNNSRWLLIRCGTTVVGYWLDVEQLWLVIGGGGFSLAYEDFGRMFDNSFPASTFFFFLKWRLGRAHFRPESVHSDSANWYDCGRVFPDELSVSSFSDRFPHYACTAAASAHSNFFGLRVCACLGI